VRKLAKWCFTHRRIVALAWVGGALGILGLGLTALGLFAPHAVHLIAVL